MVRGHIRKRGKRKDGSWRWEARYPNPLLGGTAKIEKVFRTKQEAEAWLISEASAQQRGEWMDPRQGERPFSDVIEAWRQSWYRLERGTTTRYDSILNNYLLPEFGQTPVGRITHELVQRYVNRLANDPQLSAALVRGIYSTLRAAMNHGTRMNLVRVNPCQAIDLPRSRRQDMLFLDASEVKALAEAIDPFYRVLIYTAAYTGLRSGELLALRRQDVDLLRGVIHVRRALKDVGGNLEFGETKNHTARTVGMPKFLRAMLAKHLASPGLPDALVFPSKTGKPLRHGLFTRRHFKPAVQGDQEKGIPAALPADKHALRFHDLRHTAASLAVAAGAHPKMIQEMLGHSSITITLDRYSHLYPAAHEALAEKLDAIYEAGEGEPVIKVVELR
jgi:integrase